MDHLILKKPEIVPGRSGVVKTLQNCFGYYDALEVRDALGFMPPLVAYAGTYLDEKSGTDKHYVGHRFYNCAMAEQWPHVLYYWAEFLMDTFFLPKSEVMTALLGAPEGGKAFSFALVTLMNKCKERSVRYIFSEKDVIEAKSQSSREKSKMVMGRHIILRGDKLWIGEDVVNNLSTPGKMNPLIESLFAELQGIFCVINRSPNEYFEIGGRKLPIAAVANIPTLQFRQDDPAVAEEVEKGNVIWKPKDGWVDQIIIPYLIPMAA